MEHSKDFAKGLSIGIIMDGNGRWAKSRGLPRTAGHKKGAQVFQDIADYCDELGVESVYFYAFSTENWKRPAEEVGAIMRLFGEYLIKGFALNDERMKSGKSMNYFDELQERIREIRLSERVFYQKVKDIYTTSIDYDPKAEKTVEFFKIVQNKLLWAISSQTAAELIAHRADARLPMMGMTSCDKSDPRRITKADAATAKNYLTEDEMKDLGLLVEQYLAFAESQARRQVPMYMADWIKKLNDILVINGRELLEHAGQISRKVAESIAAQQLDAYKGRLREKERRASLAELEADLQAAAKKQP